MTGKTTTGHCGQISFLLIHTRAVTIIGILAILLGCNYRRFINISILASSFASTILQQVQTWDFGNAIAAVVAVGGYMMEHLFSRKQAQLEKQMERVEAQSHQLLVPVTMQLHRMWHGCIVTFVDKHCEDTLLKRKEEYKETLVKCTNITESWGQSAKDNFLEMPTRYRNAVTLQWALEVMRQDDNVMRVTHPRELPIILHDEILKCDRNSKLWRSYEAFIRYSYIPSIERIGAIIDENGHLMEPVPAGRMKEIFQTEGNGYGLKWTYVPRMWFYSYMLAYVDSWKELLSKWDDGNYDEIRPSVDFPVGLIRFNIEMQEIVAKVEQSLIGTSQLYGHANRA